MNVVFTQSVVQNDILTSLAIANSLVRMKEGDRHRIYFANFGRKSSRRIFFITSSGTLSSGAKPVSGLVRREPILALRPPGLADGSSSLPCAFGITTRP